MHKSGEDHGFHLWSFAYQEKSFRWVGKMTPLGEKTDSGPDGVDPLELRIRDAKTLAESN